MSSEVAKVRVKRESIQRASRSSPKRSARKPGYIDPARGRYRWFRRRRYLAGAARGRRPEVGSPLVRVWLGGIRQRLPGARRSRRGRHRAARRTSLRRRLSAPDPGDPGAPAGECRSRVQQTLEQGAVAQYREHLAAIEPAAGLAGVLRAGELYSGRQTLEIRLTRRCGGRRQYVTKKRSSSTSIANELPAFRSMRYRHAAKVCKLGNAILG